MTSSTSSTASASSSTGSCTHDASGASEPALCRYAGKRCYNPRATKRNGSLHNLCHTHRVRANQNQRRMELKRRLSRAHESDAVHAAIYRTMPSSSSSLSPLALVTPLGMGDIDAHLGWIPQAPATITQDRLTSASFALQQQQQQQQLVPDYTLSAFANLDESFFMDLNGDVFAKDAAEVNMNVYMYDTQQQQQQQSDMWIVPNFLLTL